MKVLVIPDVHMKPRLFNTAQKLLKAALPDPSQLTFIHRIDNVLFMHGGLSTAFVRSLGEDLLDADIDEVISAVNAAPEDVLWNDESPLWLRPQFKDIEMYRADTYTQVVGHTPIELVFEKNGVISTDVFSTYRNGRQIGASEMVVIDTQTREYELITVE